MKRYGIGLAIATLLLGAGCVERRLKINTSPTAAQVILNDEQIGPSPVTVTFQWYGDYNVRISKEACHPPGLEGPVVRHLSLRFLRPGRVARPNRGQLRMDLCTAGSPARRSRGPDPQGASPAAAARCRGGRTLGVIYFNGAPSDKTARRPKPIEFHFWLQILIRQLDAPLPDH